MLIFLKHIYVVYSVHFVVSHVEASVAGISRLLFDLCGGERWGSQKRRTRKNKIE